MQYFLLRIVIMVETKMVIVEMEETDPVARSATLTQEGDWTSLAGGLRC